MSITYRVDVGYNTHFSQSYVWKQLKKVAEDIIDDADRICTEVLRFDFLDEAEVLTYCKALQNKDDASFVVYEVDLAIRLFASGGDDLDNSRTLKERVRQAVFRLVLADMHRAGMNVNLSTT